MIRESRTGEGLLDYCAARMGCDYISALRRTPRRQELLRIIKTVPAERYSSREWVDAMNYITEAHYKESITAEKARELLLDVLRIDIQLSANEKQGGRML